MTRTTVRIVDAVGRSFGEYFVKPFDPKMISRIARDLALIRQEEPTSNARVQTRGDDSYFWHDWNEFDDFAKSEGQK